MKRKLLSLTIAASLLLASCAGPEPAETAGSVTTMEPGPSADIMSMVDEGFSAGELELDCFVYPAAGVYVLRLGETEYGEQVRALFQELDWQEGEGTQPGDGEDGYHVCLHFGNKILFLSSGADTVETSEKTCFHALGGTALCDKLVELWPGPELRYVQMPGVEFGQSGQSCAERFLAAFEAYYRDSGAITDFKLREIQLLDMPEDSPRLTFRAFYAVKPTDPDRSYWKDKGIGEDGWVELGDDIGLSEDETGFWRCTFLNNGWNVD